jgi:hypothetical protein
LETGALPIELLAYSNGYLFPYLTAKPRHQDASALRFRRC